MIDRRTLALLVTVSVGQVLLISAQVQSREGVPVLQVAAFDAFARLQGVTGGLVDGVRGIWTGYFGLRATARENEQLRQQLLDLSVELQQQRALSAQARALEELLDVRARTTVPTRAARVIAGNITPGTLTVAIDRGRDDGIEPDLAVIGARGAVGRVIGPVASHAATVQLLTDGNAAAAVMFERSQAGGMVLGGQADHSLRADFVPVLADVQPGELVLTSGHDGIFPPGLLVGTVESVTGAGPTRVIRVRPATDFSNLTVVLVVLARPAPPDGGPS
jgi:rod shape-determining protein MreC